jgi:glycerol kinase
VAHFVAAIDQGTTSTRCMIFDHNGLEVGRHQLEHAQILPRAGWVEHNPTEIWGNTQTVVTSALNNTNLKAGDLVALGITNQRETTIVWNRKTGQPYYNAIVWQDTRTDQIAAALDRDGRGDVIRRKAGLPPATYFSGGKLQWILENVDESALTPNAATRCSAPPMCGCCGTSPAARPAACTSPTPPTPVAPC